MTSTPPVSTRPIADLVPHSGDMVLLQEIVRFDDDGIVAHTNTHKDADNPLRFNGRLTAAAGAEYGAQAMAVHGGLMGGNSAGYLSALSNVTFHVPYLDDVEGVLSVEGQKKMHDGHFLVYTFSVNDETGRVLVDGQGVIYLTHP